MTGFRVLILCLLASQLPASDLSVKLTPPSIEMGTFYAGAKVRVEGRCERDAKVVVIVEGTAVAEAFNVKGRVGPIWVNTGKVRVSGVPSLFLLFSPQPVSDFLTADAVQKYELDATALKGRMRIEPKTMDRDVIGTHYLKLKTGEGFYQLANGAVKMGEPNADGVPYAVEFQWPKKAPPGSYEVRVYECRNGSVVRTSRAPLEVAEVGFPAFMTSMAREHAPLYGFMAVLTTMLAGFGIDFLASRLRRKKAPPPPRTAQAGAPASELAHISAGVDDHRPAR